MNHQAHYVIASVTIVHACIPLTPVVLSWIVIIMIILHIFLAIISSLFSATISTHRSQIHNIDLPPLSRHRQRLSVRSQEMKPNNHMNQPMDLNINRIADS
eukprot:551763_1